MKNLLIAIALFLPLFGYSQAHLGFSFQTIQSIYPNDKFFLDTLKDGSIKLASIKLKYSSVFYEFDLKTRLCNHCVQIPNSAAVLKALTDIYNQYYTKTSDTTWIGYIEAGLEMKILKAPYQGGYLFDYKENQTP